MAKHQRRTSVPKRWISCTICEDNVEGLFKMLHVAFCVWSYSQWRKSPRWSQNIIKLMGSQTFILSTCFIEEYIFLLENWQGTLCPFFMANCLDINVKKLIDLKKLMRLKYCKCTALSKENRTCTLNTWLWLILKLLMLNSDLLYISIHKGNN